MLSKLLSTTLLVIALLINSLPIYAMPTAAPSSPPADQTTHEHCQQAEVQMLCDHCERDQACDHEQCSPCFSAYCFLTHTASVKAATTRASLQPSLYFAALRKTTNRIDRPPIA